MSLIAAMGTSSLSMPDNNVVEANLLITLNVFLTDGARLPGLSRLPFVNQVGR